MRGLIKQRQRLKNAISYHFPPLWERLSQYLSSLKRPVTISVLLVVLLLNLLGRLEWINEVLPQLQWAELKFHRFLCSFTPRLITAKWVRTVEIDDTAHQKLGEPTNRDFLATLVRNAANGDAAAIVLDVKFLAPAGLAPGQDDVSRAAQNANLFAAIREATSNGVPLVLTCWLRKGRGGGFERRPNIYDGTLFPLPDDEGGCSTPTANGDAGVGKEWRRAQACVYIGNINLPADMRRLPLVTRTNDADTRSSSLALAAVSAYEDVIDRKPRTREKEAVSSAMHENDFPLATFIPESAFQKIPIEDLAAGAYEAAVKLCRGRIIIIGGKWHTDLGHGELIDTYDTPVGKMSGMYLHANYIEALLDDRYGREVPLWIALLFDIVAFTIKTAAITIANTQRPIRISFVRLTCMLHLPWLWPALEEAVSNP